MEALRWEGGSFEACLLLAKSVMTVATHGTDKWHITAAPHHLVQLIGYTHMSSLYNAIIRLIAEDLFIANDVVLSAAHCIEDVLVKTFQWEWKYFVSTTFLAWCFRNILPRQRLSLYMSTPINPFHMSENLSSTWDEEIAKDYLESNASEVLREVESIEECEASGGTSMSIPILWGADNEKHALHIFIGKGELIRSACISPRLVPTLAVPNVQIRVRGI